LHEDRFYGFGLVEKGLGADFEAADGGGRDVIFGEEGGEDGEGYGIDVWGC
jgi:hypothetical protein